MKTWLAIFSGAEMHYSICPRSNFPDRIIQYCSGCVCACVRVREHFGGICDLALFKI